MNLDIARAELNNYCPETEVLFHEVSASSWLQFLVKEHDSEALETTSQC